MDQLNRNALIAAVQGGPAGVLIAMLAYPNQSHGETDLAAITGRDPKSIRKALRRLAALGLVQRHSRYRGWAPTSFCQQLILPAPTGPARPVAIADRETLSLPPGRSRRRPGRDAPSPYSTTTTTKERELLPLAPQWSQVHATLTETCATPPKASLAAINAAIARKDDPHDVLILALSWLSYCLSPHGRGINNPGAYVAAQLRRGTPVPSWHEPDLPGEPGRLLKTARYAQCNDLG